MLSLRSNYAVVNRDWISSNKRVQVLCRQMERRPRLIIFRAGASQRGPANSEPRQFCSPARVSAARVSACLPCYLIHWDGLLCCRSDSNPPPLQSPVAALVVSLRKGFEVVHRDLLQLLSLSRLLVSVLYFHSETPQSSYPLVLFRGTCLRATGCRHSTTQRCSSLRPRTRTRRLLRMCSRSPS